MLKEPRPYKRTGSFYTISDNVCYGATRSRFYIVWLTPLV